MKPELAELLNLADRLDRKAQQIQDDTNTSWRLLVASQELRAAAEALAQANGGPPSEQQLTKIVRALKWLGDASLHAPTNSPAAVKRPRPEPMKPTPEIIAWAMADFSEKEFLAGIREIQETGGYQLRDFIHELEEAAGENE